MTITESTLDILLLNANTDRKMTERMVARARRLHPRCRGATVEQGARYISDKASMQAAARSVARFADGLNVSQRPDALIVACFGDPAVRDLRARLPFPVLGLADAACNAACRIGARFGIVTGGREWPPILHELVAEMGLSARLSGIYALDQTGDRIARDRRAARAALKATIAKAEAGGADAVILGGAGLIGFSEELQTFFDVPLLDSVDCAVSQATELALRSRGQ